MQCQGKTRTGNRCRNRSLDGELFCDVHMRVNHSHNLALVIPSIAGILFGYFFFFGLLFETLSLNVFNINYLQYAGLDDLFLNMVRFGTVVLILLLGLWLTYAVILCVVFTLVLIVQIIRSTLSQKLSFIDLLKSIGLSVGILMLNILRRAIYIIPSREGYRHNRIIVRRDNFTRALFEIRNSKGDYRPGRPFATARTVFQNYLYFNSMANHRLTVFSILLFLFSVGLLYHAIHKAEYARACSLLNSIKQSEVAVTTPLSSAYTISQPCRLDATYKSANSIKPDILGPKSEEPDTNNGFHMGLMTDFFDFFPVTVETNEGPAELLHLRSTSRFDIFFNGLSGSPLIIPKGVLIIPESRNGLGTSFSRFRQLETKFTRLENQL
ncbi:MAG: hypothetical protein JKY04_03975, partial [Sneathiella sp.]|nr:hypothetical protein [Sneathiella sp.]